jgi:hypothetical protein
MNMAVYVWETGVVVPFGPIPPGLSFMFIVNNRTTDLQIGRFIFWNMGTTPKTAADTQVFAVFANSETIVTVTNNSSATIDLAALEIRLPNPHMNVTIPGSIPDYSNPGAFFRDSSLTENP